MGLQIIGVGGYSEVGKNMTAVKVDDEIIILDMGLYIPKLVEYEDEDPRDLSVELLTKREIVPDDSILKKERHNVKAIVVGHAHLDHVGAVPFLCHNYTCPIIATPFTIEILEGLAREKHIKIKNKIRKLNPGSVIKISNNISIEFIHITHSTIQTALIAVHTKYGTIVYANDFKLDNDPTLGNKPDYAKIMQLGNKGVLALIMESLYSHKEGKTPSEKVAREMLKDVLLGTNNKNKLVVVTTFSSHIARIKSIIEYGKRMNRKVVLLGRSMEKYVSAAEKIKFVNFRKDAEVVGYADVIKKKLKHIEKEGRDKYLIICTGNQGEPRSVLSKMIDGVFPWTWLPGDHVVFSSSTIPTKETIANRKLIEDKLSRRKIRIFKDIHVSGHAFKEDLRYMIEMLKPKHLFPSHGDVSYQQGLEDVAEELGHKKENIHLMKNGSIITLVS